MAPEQRRTPNAVDHRADIYALGVVLYEMLTGRRPEATSLTPPSQSVAIDVRLDEIVMRALSQDPEQRYQRVTEFHTQLQTVATSEGPTDEQVEDSSSAPIAPPPLETAPRSTARRTLITFGSVFTVVFAFAFFHSLFELLLMLAMGTLTFSLVKNARISPLSAFSKTSRVCLSMAAVPALFVLATLAGQLLPGFSSSAPVVSEPDPPERRRLNYQGQTFITVDDGLRTHYVFHFPGEITTVGGMSLGGGRAEPPTWSRDGLLHLPSDQRITYERESSDLATLVIDGAPWDLRKGALFQISPDGTITQRPIYPPLLREENLAEWVQQMEFLN